MNSDALARKCVEDLERQMTDSHLILCRTQGKAPLYFAGYHKRTRAPLYTFDASLARRFALDDKMLLDAFVLHLKRAHAHHVFPVRHANHAARR